MILAASNVYKLVLRVLTQKQVLACNVTKAVRSAQAAQLRTVYYALLTTFPTSLPVSLPVPKATALPTVSVWSLAPNPLVFRVNRLLCALTASRAISSTSPPASLVVLMAPITPEKPVAAVTRPASSVQEAETTNALGAELEVLYIWGNVWDNALKDWKQETEYVKSQCLVSCRAVNVLMGRQTCALLAQSVDICIETSA